MSKLDCDVIVIGSGVAGLWTAARLTLMGLSVIVLEADAVGGTQTLACQGMLHGGQKYALGGGPPSDGRFADACDRWEACFRGEGELDLRSAQMASKFQVAWGCGQHAPQSVEGTGPIPASCMPESLDRLVRAGFVDRDTVHLLPERCLDVPTLVSVLSGLLTTPVVRARVQRVSTGGFVETEIGVLRAQAVVACAGVGNERVLHDMGIDPALATRRRPLRQVAVSPGLGQLCGHALDGGPKPRLTVTTHAVGTLIAWCLGGSLAERGAWLGHDMTVTAAISELTELFPQGDWQASTVVTLPVDRAEPMPIDPAGLPEPAVIGVDRAMTVWPSKLTLAPHMSDIVLERLEVLGVSPRAGSVPTRLPAAPMGRPPWERALLEAQRESAQ